MAAVKPSHSMSADSAAANTALIGAVLQTQKLITRHLNFKLRALGLSFARYEVLVVLVTAERPMPIKEIVRALSRHPTTIGSLVDGLQATRLAERTVNNDDRRSTLVTITDKGRAVTSSAAEAVEALTLADPEVMHRLRADLQHLLAATLRPSDSELDQHQTVRHAEPEDQL